MGPGLTGSTSLEGERVGQPRGSANALRDLDLPAMLLSDDAVRSNVVLMAEYCSSRGVMLAPHAKTSMTSYISDLQVDAGAWGLTAASIVQARGLYAMGHRRILMANVLVEDRGISWVADHFLGETEEASDFLLYVDSMAGLRILEAHLAVREPAKRLGVLVELGYAGGRTGARSVEAARELARRTASSPWLELRGVAGYEGLMPRCGGSKPPGLEKYLRSLHRTLTEFHREQLFDRVPIITAGGSSFFDSVVAELAPTRFGFPVETILRSGCYATHDHGLYQETSPLDGRLKDGGDRFTPALELVAVVWSRPEPELVIAGFGRRDVPTDERLPVVLGRFSSDGVLHVEAGAEVIGVNDQHAFVSVNPDSSLKPGDLISLGISHPCGAFDRWRALPIVDAARNILSTAAPQL